MSEYGERIERGIMQLHKDLVHGRFTLYELEFFKLGFEKLAAGTGKAIERATMEGNKKDTTQWSGGKG